MDENEKKNALEAASKSMEKLTQCVNDIFEKVKFVLKDYLELLKAYPNKRVKHNALHHPKKKVRDKNMKRIFKWMAKQTKKQKKQKGCETHGNQKGC